MRNHFLRATVGNSGGYVSGNFYPMFGVKLFDDVSAKNDISSNPVNGSKYERPLQRALSFDTTNTTELDGTELTSSVLSIMDTSYYTCNSDFGTGGEYISAIKIEHYDSSKNLKNYGEFAFNGSSFNIYDHACNALPNIYNGSSEVYSLPSQMGTITSASLDGTAISVASGKTIQHYIVVNTSTYAGTVGSDTTSSWTRDSGDYCFLGISDKNLVALSSDSLDYLFATTKGLAFGISDSDGRATVSGTQYPVRTLNLGINRRYYGYYSLHTNWASRNYANNHSGQTSSGYFLVSGKVK